MSEENKTNSETLQVLLWQYSVVAAHHTHFMGLIWQVPLVTVSIAGALAAVSFGYVVPLWLRAAILAMGSFFLFVMTVALERYRMFQLRRRKDMEEIEMLLVAYGGKQISWSGDTIAGEISGGGFVAPGVAFYRLEGFNWLRWLMYVVLVILLLLTLVTLIQAIAAN